MNHSSSACVLPAAPRKPKEPQCPDATANPVAGSCGTGPWCNLADAFLGLEGLHVLEVDRRDPARLVVAVETPERTAWCRGCGVQARSHARRSVPIHDIPAHGSPVVLHWNKRVFRCHEKQCAMVTFTEEHHRIGPREKLTVRACHWAHEQLKKQDIAVSAIARQLGVDWHTIWDNIKALAQLELADPKRLEGVTTLGVDEHIWRHTGFPSGRVLTGFVDHSRDAKGRIRARLLDLVPGRSGKAYADWLKAQPEGFRPGIKVATLDPFRGYANAIDEQLPDAVTVLDAFHVVKLGSTMVDEIRRRVQKEATGKRGVKEDPLYRSRRLLLQGAEHLKKKQRTLLTELLEAGDKDGEVTIAWNAYQELRLIYYVPHPDGPGQVQALLNKFGDCPIPEVKRLCKTLKKWQTEICAYFDTKGASNGPTEAINGVIETTRRVARGFRNFENYRIRSLLSAGGHRYYRG